MVNSTITNTTTATTGVPVTNIGTGIPSRLGNNPPPNNPEGLDPNVIALIQALGNVNLNLPPPSVIAQHRELNLVRPAKFSGTEAEDPNEWLDAYNRAAEANN